MKKQQFNRNFLISRAIILLACLILGLLSVKYQNYNLFFIVVLSGVSFIFHNYLFQIITPLILFLLAFIFSCILRKIDCNLNDYMNYVYILLLVLALNNLPRRKQKSELSLEKRQSKQILTTIFKWIKLNFYLLNKILLLGIFIRYFYEILIFVKYLDNIGFAIFFSVQRAALIVLPCIFIKMIFSSSMKHKQNKLFYIQLVYLSLMLILLPKMRRKLYSLPYITKSNKESVRLWEQVKISGKNFGLYKENFNKVLLNNEPQRIIKWSSNEIVFVVQPIDVSNGPLKIVDIDLKESNEINLILSMP